MTKALSNSPQAKNRRQLIYPSPIRACVIVIERSRFCDFSLNMDLWWVALPNHTVRSMCMVPRGYAYRRVHGKDYVMYHNKLSFLLNEQAYPYG